MKNIDLEIRNSQPTYGWAFMITRLIMPVRLTGTKYRTIGERLDLPLMVQNNKNILVQDKKKYQSVRDKRNMVDKAYSTRT
jgi:hypothetical protein